MPNIFDVFFSDLGYSVSDFYELKLLNPSFEIVFSNQEKMSVPENFNQLYQLFETIEAGNGKQLNLFMDEAEYKYKKGMEEFVYKPSLTMKQNQTTRYIYSICILILSFFINQSANAQAFIDLETGSLYTGYNDVRIPGNQGTPFSLKDDLKVKSQLFYRLRGSYVMQSRHSLSLLYAPLETESEGSIGKEILFEGVLFPANTQIYGIYKFNSYRLTYRYNILNKPKYTFGLGLTAKIRDAKISLTSLNQTSEKANIGFVPIVNFMLSWNFNDKLGLLLDGDALAAPQGRAEDILFALTYKFSENFGIRAGYRILEGGADNDEVYNFALFHYASVGLTYSLKKEQR